MTPRESSPGGAAASRLPGCRSSGPSGAANWRAEFAAQYKRGRFFGQDWAKGESSGTNYGVYAAADLGRGWNAKAGRPA